MARSSLSSIILCAFAPVLLLGSLQAASIERIWLSHDTHTPNQMVVNWETDSAADSIVDFGLTESLGQTLTQSEKVTLHHVSIPLAEKDRPYYYRVRSGPDGFSIASFKAYPSEKLPVVIVGDWGSPKSKTSVLLACPRSLSQFL